MINELTILPGIDKNGKWEDYDRITLSAGETISIVGPTGSGKTALITDIELLAQRDTATKRQVLIDGSIPGAGERYDPSRKPIAMITQNTKCFADLSTDEFLRIHARARGIRNETIIADTIGLANNFTGEKIRSENRVTSLSGGQTRSLLIADAILIGATPVILLD
jgi:ABC-type lipoprotein export system ATPase subunit